MAQKVLPHVVAFVVHRGATVLVDDNPIAILDGFNNFLVAHDLEQGLRA
ncbi:TPA: hypothetical protein QCG56_001637 [Enterobacter cancerogenus]|nr:hypothetical protein [Enterobacter cancerogenus]HDR2164451.1 hypothetical protein [Enterobacter cancerogenus]HDR2267377.1 hypothetical protein [Enterobacter cancerogenus]